jgi:mRNA-degrading endonuclease RelE of RelBE toxin-antitoxin system
MRSPSTRAHRGKPHDRLRTYAIDLYAPLAHMGGMPSVLHTVAELPQFARDCRAAGLSEDQRSAIVDAISADPLQGDEIRGSGGVRKVRVAGRGKGKSGGYRVVTAYLAQTLRSISWRSSAKANVQIFLLPRLQRSGR